MIRLLSLLLVVGVWLAHAEDTNTSRAETNGSVEHALDRAQLQAELERTEGAIASFKSPWKSALEHYVRMRIDQGKLALVEQELDASDLNDSVRRTLTKEKAALEARMKALDDGKIRDILYYVRPNSENLRLDDPMYRRYELHAQDLQRYKALLRQKLRLMRELSGNESGNSETDASIKKTIVAIDTIEKIEERLRHLSDARLTKINEYNKELASLKDELESNNIWQKSYTAYLTYLEVKKELSNLQKQIDAMQKHNEHSEKLDTLLSKQRVLSDQLALLKSHGTSPFADLLKPEEITKVPEISNPLDIFSGFSFNKKLSSQLQDYIKRGEELQGYLKLLLEERRILKALAAIDGVGHYEKQIAHLDEMIDKYRAAYSTLQDTANVYAKRVEEIELKIKKAVQEQLYKLMNIGGIILFLLVFFFIMKQIAKKYISDNERFYMANKIITFANVTLILLVLLFNYIENVGYVVTVLGFASAGIAIAMKDWFMSMLGWLVIVFGGSIHVGDRIRVDMNGMKYVGDVLDISLLRITILEDITLTSYMHNRRAGRVIFIPNNYIFTHMIANYTHVSLKTVWDGIDITITFDSNHKKATHIAKEITRKYAKGYTDITRNQLNKLRSRYNLKNTNVDPRIYAFAEENGVRISAWYLTNAYATLTLRSTISMEILDAFGKEDDITIAYPTQRLRLQHEPLPQPKIAEDDAGEPV